MLDELRCWYVCFVLVWFSVVLRHSSTGSGWSLRPCLHPPTFYLCLVESRKGRSLRDMYGGVTWWQYNVAAHNAWVHSATCALLEHNNLIDNGIREGEACARLTSLTFGLCVMDECTHLPSSSLRSQGSFCLKPPKAWWLLVESWDKVSQSILQLLPALGCRSGERCLCERWLLMGSRPSQAFLRRHGYSISPTKLLYPHFVWYVGGS